MIVYKLTESQKNSLLGVEYKEGVAYNPVQDANGNWVISEEEKKYTDLPLEVIEYEPIIYDEF